jgi:hypothetical protein
MKQFIEQILKSNSPVNGRQFKISVTPGVGGCILKKAPGNIRNAAENNAKLY